MLTEEYRWMGKSQIPDDGLVSWNMLQETTDVWCIHTTYCGDEVKWRNVETWFGRLLLIHISLFPFSVKVDKPQRLPLVIMCIALLSTPFPILLTFRMENVLLCSESTKLTKSSCVHTGAYYTQCAWVSLKYIKSFIFSSPNPYPV
jgi:hypothetical protein